MIITLKKGTSDAQAESLKELLKSHNIEPRVWKGELETVIGCVGDIAHLDPGLIEALDVVETVQRIHSLERIGDLLHVHHDTRIALVGERDNLRSLAVQLGALAVVDWQGFANDGLDVAVEVGDGV